MRRGWILVENIDRVPDMSEAEKSQIRGEAYCIMASRYIDGLKAFGGLPLVHRAYRADDFFERGRATVEQTVEFVDSLLTCAINEPNFIWRHEDQQTLAGRISKSVAYALRAKLYLIAASPLYNDVEPYLKYNGERPEQADLENQLHVWLGGYKPEYWQKALGACEDFFRLNTQNGNWYALIQPDTQDEAGYCNAYRKAYWNRGNSEKILEVHHSYRHEEWSDQNISGPGNVSHQGHFNPTLEFMEMFGMKDGKNYPYKNIYGTNNPNNYDIMADRDPRLYENLLVTRENLMEQYANVGTTVEIWKGGNINHHSTLNSWTIRFLTGTAMFKWILDYWKMANTPVQFSYLRMADMHMMYAECLAQTGNLTGALDELHKVRSRVGLGRIEVMNPELNLTTNKANLIKEILRERAIEFGCEDRRYWDMTRYKLVDDFKKPLHELITYRKTNSGGKNESADTRWDRNTEPWPNFIYEKSAISTGVRKWWTPDFWTNKWLLHPIPRSEINKGYGLTQNPGW